ARARTPTAPAAANGPASLTVLDAPPTISSSDVHFCEGDTATNSGSFSDYDDAVTVTEKSGDIGSVSQMGTGVGSPGTWNWTSGGALAAGSYTIHLTATNADGSTAATSFTVTVGNETPSVNTVVVSPSSQTVTEGNAATPVSVSGTWSDPGKLLSPGETYTGTVDWGDGSMAQAITVNTNGTYSSPTHVYTLE